MTWHHVVVNVLWLIAILSLKEEEFPHILDEFSFGCFLRWLMAMLSSVLVSLLGGRLC